MINGLAINRSEINGEDSVFDPRYWAVRARDVLVVFCDRRTVKVEMQCRRVAVSSQQRTVTIEADEEIVWQ